MTASTTHCLPRPESALKGITAPSLFSSRSAAGEALCRWLAPLVLALVLLTAMAGARADGIQIKAAGLGLANEVYQLNAVFKISLGTKLEEALTKGVPLFFRVEFQVLRPRWYWFDEKIADVWQQYRLSYNALTRQYELSMADIHHNYMTFAEAMQALSRIRRWQVLDRSLLSAHETYEIGLRMRLEVSQLPKPLQVNALASKDWNLDSDWHWWALTP